MMYTAMGLDTAEVRESIEDVQQMCETPEEFQECVDRLMCQNSGWECV